jgi:hypothetical protein
MVNRWRSDQDKFLSRWITFVLRLLVFVLCFCGGFGSLARGQVVHGRSSQTEGIYDFHEVFFLLFLNSGLGFLVLVFLFSVSIDEIMLHICLVWDSGFFYCILNYALFSCIQLSI